VVSWRYIKFPPDSYRYYHKCAHPQISQLTAEILLTSKMNNNSTILIFYLFTVFAIKITISKSKTIPPACYTLVNFEFDSF